MRYFLTTQAKSPKTHGRWGALKATLPLLALAVGGLGTTTSPLEGQTTRPERTDFRETSSYADVMGFVTEVAEGHPDMHLTTFGYSAEGRALPLVVVGQGIDASPASVRSSGKTVVYLQGNIHAGEVCGKEALQILLREIAQGNRPDVLEHLVLLIAPIYNADGNERVALDNRPGQDGPFGGMGQRPNAEGYDLNRDHMKLDTPEARSVVTMFNDYDPHVAVDLHTTNGTRHAYHLTYAPPLHPNTPDAINDLLRKELFPRITDQVRAKVGWEFYHYGNAITRAGQETGWYTFDHRPRFNNNYIGLRNRVAILGEAYSYATFRDRVYGSLYLVDEILEFLVEDGVRVREMVAAADASVVGERLGVRATFARTPADVEILMGEVEEVLHPLSGHSVRKRLDVVRPESMAEFIAFESTEWEVAPEGYVVPGELTEVIARLRTHGVQMTPFTSDVEGQVFQVDSVRTADRPFQGHNEQNVFGAYRAATLQADSGDLWVPVDQPLGRLIFSLLEPRSDDGFANWGFLADVMESGNDYPISRVPATP